MNNLWGEKNLTEPEKSCSINKEVGRADTIISTKKESIDCECKNTGKRKIVRKKTTKQFVEQAKSVHGEKYIYTKVSYDRSNIKIEIVCPKHGSFWQEPSKHLGGQGCMGCRQTSNVGEFIEKSNFLHGEKYDYSKCVYTKSTDKVEIICKNHGPFWQMAQGHLTGKGCPKCANNEKRTTEEFVKLAIEIHGGKYKYDKVIYKNNKTKVEIVCGKHGSFFQSPRKHLCKNGCEKCGHHVSKMETEFLDYLGINNRGMRIDGWRNKAVDGYDESTKTIYEFLGDYWHGNPEIYHGDVIHPEVKISYGELHKKTFENFKKLKNLGYNIKYIWESDWKKYKTQINTDPNILTYIFDDVLTLTHGSV